MADGPADETSCESCHQMTPNARVDYVRQEYKRYKRKKPPPDFSEVIDFQDPSTFRNRVEKIELNEGKCHSNFGLCCVKEWRAYELKSCLGFIFIVNPFLPGTQHYWTRRCIEDFPRKPNVCNLDTHVTLDPDRSVWELSQSNDENHDLMDRLRWVHLGYHFDYNVVNYKPERYYDFPSDLAGMMQHVASAVGYPDYSPEAGIVNYYPLGGSMGGHTDHYESDLSWPLISVSFGQTAIFLIGGATRDIRPVALYVRSGDIIIMSGKSRTAFHAVPRIVKVGKDNEAPSCLKWEDGLFASDVIVTTSDDLSVPDENAEIPDAKDQNICNSTCVSRTKRSEKPLFQEFSDDNIIRVLRGVSISESGFFETNERCQFDQINFFGKSMKTLTSEEWKQFEIYLSKTRININVRQVHEKGKTMNSFCL